jgi:LysM repeat protein
MSRRLARLCSPFLIALALAACNRTLILLPTDESGPNTPPPDKQRVALVVEASGQADVRANADAEWSEAKSGAALAQASQVRTGADGRMLLRLTEGTKIRVGPDTTFAFSLLNPFPENLLTTLALDEGRVWVLLNGGAMDIEMLGGNFRASARASYMSVDYDADAGQLLVTCLQGTCYFNDIEIPANYKLVNAESNIEPEAMSFADYGEWGVNVPEATQLAYLATEAIVQGSATMPVVPTDTPSPTEEPSATPTLLPDEPSRTPAPPTATATPAPPTATPRTTFPTFTPIPYTPAPVIGRHVVLAGETLFCIARGYGVLPFAIAQANSLPVPYTVFPGQTLNIPEVQWFNISPGPVCPTQFQSPFPGLPLPTATPSGPPLNVTLELICTFNCGSREGDYTIRVTVLASGGVEPYTYDPAQIVDVTIPHCTEGEGTVTVTSADGQSVTTAWFYHDVSCVDLPTDTPPPPITETPTVSPP